MLADDYPYIRDVVTIDARLNVFCNRPGARPVFLLGRKVQHAPGCNLEITGRPLIIVADVYDGTNGMISAAGNPGVSAGAAGGPGGSVTVMCRRSINARVSVTGGPGAAGAPGADGAPGVDGYATSDQYVWVVDDPGPPPIGHEEFRPGETFPGTKGGDGGWGGRGGAGGNGGTITFTSISDDAPVLEAFGNSGGPGGPAGVAGRDGRFSEGGAIDGAPGEEGAWGVDGTINYTNVDEAAYPAGLRPLLDSTGPSYANYWAPFRIVTGDYFYHRYNRSVPERADYARLAAIEFERALELQPNNADAKRLQQQIAGFPTGDGGVWVGGGTNALGLPRDLDVLPSFDVYIDAFTSFGEPLLDFLSLGLGMILDKKMDIQLAEFVDLQRQQAAAARDNGSDDLAIAQSEQKLVGEEVRYAQQQLDEATSEIRKALVELEHQGHAPSLSVGDIVGTIAQVGIAVVSVMAAVPTGGASLVALLPNLVVLANTVTDSAPAIAKAVFDGSKVDTKAVDDAYKAVDKSASAVVTGAKSIYNFVTLVQNLEKVTTTDNSKYMALVKRGLELVHQLLMARNRATLAQQRVDAGQARLTRAEDVVKQATKLRDELVLDAASVKRAGLLAIATAQSKTDALLGLAFRAQRSVEIYTLQNEEQNLFLDAGLISPDVTVSYYEGEIDEVELWRQLMSSWSDLILKPHAIRADYIDYFDQPHDQDTLRRSFKAADPQLSDLKTRHQFTFWIDASKVPAGHFDAKIKSVRLALVGASHPDGEVSCELRHGGTYEQRRRDNSIATQLLKPRVSTRPAKTTPLLPDEGLGDDPPLTAPRSLAFWGRGVGGDWQVTIPQEQFDSGLDLSGLTEVQVWIGYQFVR
jgi:hypothetical protein